MEKITLKKKRFFYICVEETRDLEVAFRIYDFLLRNGIAVSNPLLKTKCLFENDELLKKLTEEEYEEVVIVCISRHFYIRLKDYRDIKPSFKDKILHYLFPAKFFALGKLSQVSSNKKVFRILLDMNTIERTRSSPLAVFIHELLHLKRRKHCNKPYCLGHSHVRFFYLCDNCLKILEEIIEESKVDANGKGRNPRLVQKAKRTS